VKIPDGWRQALGDRLDPAAWARLVDFVATERAAHVVHPDESDVFMSLEVTPLEAVKVVIVGQDPYPTPGHAHGLCFSVRPGTKLPGSLRNIYRELKDDLGCDVPTGPAAGCLLPWARQGVLLLNTVLTVRSGEAGSHAGKGWEAFTDAVLGAVNDKPTPVVFVLWGKAAQKKLGLIDTERHAVVAGAHPSPLSAAKWFGSRPFSQVNAALVRLGSAPIDWRIPSSLPTP
jgi:uracil-DNA glycosylase